MSGTQGKRGHYLQTLPAPFFFGDWEDGRTILLCELAFQRLCTSSAICRSLQRLRLSTYDALTLRDFRMTVYA